MEQQPLTALDWIAALVAGTNLVALLAFPVIGRSFGAIFQDLGGANLPLLTRLATSFWFPGAMAVPGAAALAMALRAKVPLATRRAWIIGAFATAVAGLALCGLGLYLPLFRIGDAIKAD